MRILIRLFSLFAAVLLGSCIFFCFYGIPAPLLREFMKRINTAGIPIEVESVALTLRGWKASGVSCYSRYPDNIEPIFYAEKALLSARKKMNDSSTGIWKVDIEAAKVKVNPPIEWDVDLPKHSSLRMVEDVRVSIEILPNRIEFTEGDMSWLGIDFQVNGAVLKHDRRKKDYEKRERIHSRRSVVFPPKIGRKNIRLFEEKLKGLEMGNGSKGSLDFVIDPSEYRNNQFDVSLHAFDLVFNGVKFKRFSCAANYLFPSVTVERLSLDKDGQPFNLSGRYNVEIMEIEVSVSNTITSKDLLQLLPQPVLDILAKSGLQLTYIPQFTLDFGPAAPPDLLNSVSGIFSIRNMSYGRLLVESAGGCIARTGNRLECTGLEVRLAGQEAHAGRLGSTLAGGPGRGEFFWDAGSREFGLRATAGFDPNLLFQPLSVFSVKTNVINLFKFEELPPQIDLELGGSLVNRSAFFVKLRGKGNRVLFQDAAFSSVDVRALYTNDTLRLDRIVCMRGAHFIKGQALIDFPDSTVSFDISGNMPPKVLEDAISAELDFFGSQIKTSGDTWIKTRGILDWKTMKSTAFSAEIKASRVRTPVAVMEGFSASLTASGPLISIQDAIFDIYGGKGKGGFSIRLDPASSSLPYEMEVQISDSSFNECLLFFNPSINPDISGTLSGKVFLQSDISEDFFVAADGTGQVAIANARLTDLPLFSGFSKFMRKVVPNFDVFSITGLDGTFAVRNGVLYSDDAYFEGDVISVRGSGSYSKQNGFNAAIQTQVFSENHISKLIQTITSPISKLFELQLRGPLSNPSWHLGRFIDSKEKETAPNHPIESFP